MKTKNKKLTPEQVQKQIDKMNQAYKKASKKQKCIMIAKDVIAQIRLGAIKPKSGSWVEIGSNLRHVLNGEDAYRSQAQPLLIAGGQCHSCMLGSALISKIRHANDCTVGRLYEKDGDDIVRDLPFSPKQTKLMEQAFELGQGGFGGIKKDSRSYFGEDSVRAVAFGKRYKTAKSRQIGIMRNVIKNGGKFVP